MCPYMEPDAETSSEQSKKSPPNPSSPKKIYVIGRSLISMVIADISYCAALVCFTAYVDVPRISRTRYGTNT